MNTTHIGKIGRLPQNIRHFLGLRLADGVPNKEVVKWLNKNETVQNVLQDWFGGRAITEQNLSEWKQTGHLEWVRREERRALALKVTEQRFEESMEPEESTAEKEVSDRLGRELGMEMAVLALALVEQDGSTEERWQRLCGVYKEVSQVRRDDHRASRARIQRERWKHEQELEEAADEKATNEAMKARALELIHRPAKVAMMAETFGHGEHARTMAELVLRIKAGEDPEEVMEWFEEAQKEWGKPEETVRPARRQPRENAKCARTDKVKANDEERMTNGVNNAEGEEVAPQEAPSVQSRNGGTGIQDREKHQETKLADHAQGEGVKTAEPEEDEEEEEDQGT